MACKLSVGYFAEDVKLLGLRADERSQPFFLRLRDFLTGILNHLKWYTGCEYGFGMLLPIFEYRKMLCKRNTELAKAFDRICTKERHLHVAAGEILSNHATPDDVPLLVDVLSTPKMIQCEDWRLGSALEAFWHLDGIGHMPEIENIFITVQHSYYRRDAAWAMDATAPDVFQANYAYECLWDCHADTRICGCETVSLSLPGALARLKELADDNIETDSVRENAKVALDDF